MPPKILLLGPARHAVSGVSTHLNHLFSSGLREGFQLEHFEIGSEGRQAGRLSSLARHLTLPVRFVLRLLRARPQIVHLNTSLNPKAYWRDVVFLILAKLARRKVVYQVHGGALPQDFFHGRRGLTAWLRWSLRLPDAIVLLAKVELHAYRAFVGPHRLNLIPNAVEAEAYAPRCAAGTHVPRLLYLGRLVRTKGLFELLEAARALRHRAMPFELMLAGDGPDRAELQARVEALGMAGNVVFQAPVFGAEKNRLLETADVLVMPSYAEGLPYALLEGMAAGLAVVATAVGAIPDVVENDQSGLLVPPREVDALAQALVRVTGDAGLRARLGEAARQRAVQHHGLERMAQSFAQLYEALLTAEGLRPAMSPDA